MLTISRWCTAVKLNGLVPVSFMGTGKPPLPIQSLVASPDPSANVAHDDVDGAAAGEAGELVPELALHGPVRLVVRRMHRCDGDLGGQDCGS
eukprot:9283935-Pyramimonas_sp.AAC.2